jgi:hypothetical protein
VPTLRTPFRPSSFSSNFSLLFPVLGFLLIASKPSKQKREKRAEQWERNSEREYVLRYLYLTHSLICAFDPERSSNIHNSFKRREIYSGKEPLKGRLLKISISQ